MDRIHLYRLKRLPCYKYKNRNKNGYETEYIRTEKLTHIEPAEKNAAIKRKDRTKVEYVHSLQVGKEEMRQLREAEIRETIAKNGKIEKRVEERIHREDKKKKRDAGTTETKVPEAETK